MSTIDRFEKTAQEEEQQQLPLRRQIMRVSLKHDGYLVPNEPRMIDDAIQAIREDLSDELKRLEGMGSFIHVEPAPEATEADVDEFFTAVEQEEGP